MRIISPFRDYYDLHYVEENPILYVRNTSQVGTELLSNYRYHGINIIGFCGELYFLYYFNNRKTQTITYSYDLNAFSDFYRKQLLRIKESLPKEEIKKIFLQYNVPIFFIDDLLTLNPNLSELNFMKIKNSIEAYQEIELYLGNVILPKEKIPTPLTNEEKIVSKGFDLKYSFRKEKQNND